MEPIKVEELKTEKCCRISAEDLIEMGELCGPSASKSPTKRKPNSKPMIIVVDIRNPEEYPWCFIKSVLINTCTLNLPNLLKVQFSVILHFHSAQYLFLIISV